MLRVETRKNGNNGDEVSVYTNEGEFILSREFEDLYIGFIDSENNEPKEFKITKEDINIYNIFHKLIFWSSEKKDSNEAILVSDENGQEIKSTLTLKENEECSEISLIFTKSRSKEWQDTYFVKLEGIECFREYFYFLVGQIFNELAEYDPKGKEIAIEEYMYHLEHNSEKPVVRGRKAC